MRCLVLYFALLFIFTSCKKDVGKVNYGNYPADIGKIIGTTCAVSGCHNALSYPAAGNYNLESWLTMFGGSSSGSPVIPYSSKFSSLCYFVNTYADLGIQNVPVMPINKAQLSYDQVKRIKDWIDAGAPDVNGNVMWADNPLRKKLYAVNQGCDVVTVFDSQSQLPIRYVDVGRPGISDSPHQVRVSPDGKYWYVIFVNYNIMEKYRCSDDSYVGKIPLTPVAAGTSTDPLDDAISWNVFNITKDGKRAYCVSFSFTGRVVAVDLENMKLLHSLVVPNSPHGLVLNSDETKFYVAAQVGNFISEIDTSFSNSPVQISLENGAPINTTSSLDPHDMILSPNGNDIFITCQTSNQVRVFNIPTNSVTAIISTGNYPQEIVYSKSLNKYFVSCTLDASVPGTIGSVMRIDPLGFSTVKIACGYEPHGICVDENKKTLYVLSRNIQASGPLPHHTSVCGGRNGFLNFVDLNTFKVMGKKYELSSDPYFINARP